MQLASNSQVQKWSQGWRLFVICLLLSVIAGVSQGQDANWDLKNYHYYAPHAWLNDRYEIDIAPAQLQTWHSPFADLPYYWMAQAGLNSIIITALLSLTAGVTLFLLLLIAKILSPQLASGIGGAMLILLALTGAAGARVIGTTMSEWHLSALVLTAILLMLKSIEYPQRYGKFFISAGVFGGAAVGLKLTAAPFAIGLAAMCLLLPGTLLIRSQRMVLLGIGGVIGFLVFFAPWAWSQYERYSNPLFPYFNNVFNSPLVVENSFRDFQYGAKTFVDAIRLPFLLLRNSQLLVSEPVMRDPRLLLAFLSLAYLCWRYWKDQSPKYQLLLPCAIFFIVSYVIWAFLFGIYRYVLPLELLAGLFILAAASTLPIRRKSVGLIVVALIVIAAAKTPTWGRIDHGMPAVAIAPLTLPPNTLVVIASTMPLGYVVPSFPKEVRTISILNNIMYPDILSGLQKQALTLATQHKGPMYRLMDTSVKNESYYGYELVDKIIERFGFKTHAENCLPIASVMQPSGLALCPFERVSQQ